MARVFSITSATDTVKLDEKGNGELSFTVTNTTDRILKGRAVLVPLQQTKKEWLSLDKPEREFTVPGTQQFVVRVSVPSGSPAGKYTFRLDVVSVERPDEDFAQGPVAAFTVAPSPPPAPTKPFPWWILIVVAAVVLIGGGLGLLLALRGTKVPKVVRLTEQDATKELQQANLKANVAPKKSYDHVVEPGKVSKQDPPAGTRVSRGATVTLTFEGQPVLVPDVTTNHLPLLDAVQKLFNSGLGVDPPTPQRVCAFDLVNRVVAQNPAANTPVAPDTVVHLTVCNRVIPPGPWRNWETVVGNPNILRELERARPIAPPNR